MLYDGGKDPRSHFEAVTGGSQRTVGECLRYWKEQYVEMNLRLKTQELYQSTVLKHLTGAFPGRAIGVITVEQWADFFVKEERKNPRRARQLFYKARTAIGWCTRR